MLDEHQRRLLEKWNARLEVKPGERVKNDQFTDETITVDLLDGRTIVVPLARYPKLLDATDEQRKH